MFNKKRVIKVGNETIELEPKPGLFSFGRSRNQQRRAPAGTAAEQQQVSNMQSEQPSIQPVPKPVSRAGPGKPSRIRLYIEGVGAKHKGLELALRERGIKGTVYDFIKRMLIASAMLGVILAFTAFLLFGKLHLPVAYNAIFSVLLGVVIFRIAFINFLNFPARKSVSDSKGVERDILFAARDMIISLRSGMPLFNAIVLISTGYGAASKEFAKIVELVQLGMPLEDAIDNVVEGTKSQSFRRIMLQASVSIRAGADVVSALQSVIDQVSQERIIELRRYGQRLNAIAMFYMLFGVILPSMGIAVVTILTTFIALFTVTTTLLMFVLVGLLFLQIIFLMLIRSSRPVFSM
ncbi:MAG: type II secretion system F family protein [Candidatus Marsarchaeota archaeon]|jgi:flagellar protein FlaJ|nr:type II secretion system F family protein [Candidatus Marsarchaeota archaeon]MCL5419083.1 type II secretion system F family protein [Candidatus Marsarchaeota archaeon]